MRTLGRKGIITSLALGLLWVGLCPTWALADGDGKNDASKPDSPKIQAPAPLTERERLLLDRVELLEKRVAELETNRNKPAGSKAESEASQPAGAASGTATAAPGEAAAPGAIAKNSADATMGAQATENGNSGAAKPAKADPFSFADFTWLNGNSRTVDTPYATKFFTPEVRADVDYNYSFNHPKDDTIGGSSEVFRHGEVQVTQLGVGGDFHYDNVRARLMTQFGMYSQTTPRNDASPSRGQWQLDNAYRYISEAYGGYHFNALHGINVDAGIFMSYVGLFSYYQFDNWAYQPSYVSSNTPWFFNGVRVQIFPTEHLKIEPWFTNGWQS